MYQKTFTYLLTGCLLAGLGAAPLRAQFSSAVEGTVSDSSGAVIPNATVTLRNIGTGISQTTATSSTGYYRFPSLPASMFKLSATASGFKTTDLADFRLQIAETRTFNITLEVGTETTIVSVTDQPPLVETSEGRVSGIIESQKLVDLPLVGRNFYSLVVLTPGVTGLPTGGTNAYAQSLVDVFVTELGVGMNAGGNRAEQNRFMLDSGGITSMVRGGVTNVTPNAESVQELRVTVNNFSAENGTGAGANVTAITKSGGNDFHGSASWFYTGNKITARNVFTPGENPVFRRNEWTGAIGGPVIRNKTFFFASMDILRSAVADSSTVREVTPEFVALAQQLKPNNISTNLMRNFNSGLIPNRNFRTAGQIVSPAVNCAGLPTPNTPIQTPIGMVPCNMNITGDADFAITPPREGFQWNTRIDHNLTDRDRLYGSFYKNNLDTVGGQARAAFRAPGEQYTLYGNLNYTHTFSPTLLNEAAMSYVRVDGRSYCLECQIPSISVTGDLTGNGFGNGGPTIFIQNNFEWRDVLTWNRGGHSFKAGFTLNKWQSNFNPTLGYQRPNFTFQNIFDFANDDPISQGNIGFNPVTGDPYVANVAERQSPLSLFVQDNWKVKSNLSVTLGMRWETFGVVTQPTGMTNVQWQTGNDFTSRIADGKTVLVDQIFNGDYNNFGPRMSFAWDPSRQGKMSIRGGYGIFFDPVATQLYGGSHFNPPIWAIATASRNTPPFVPLFALGRNNTDPYDFPRPANIRTGLDSRNGLLSGLVNATWIDPDMAAAYNHNYFFGVQYSLAPDWVVEANYVGTAGHKLYAKFNVNRVNGDLLDGTLNRLNPSFGSINYAHAPFNSSYHGGNLSLKKRFSRGLGFDAAWTFGKAIDNMSGFTAGQPVDINDWSRTRGLADFQVNHKLALNLTWYSPELGGMNPVLRGVAGGWQVGAVTILQGGNPFTVNCTQAFSAIRTGGVITGNSGCDYNADGTNFDVPHAPSSALPTDFERSDYITGLFPASAFPVPALGQQGNLGRNTYFGPGYANTDISIMKNFKLPWFLGDQGSNLQFRGELYNLFNRVNLNQVQTNLGNANFGRSTSARNGRYAQFGLRFSF